MWVTVKNLPRLERSLSSMYFALNSINKNQLKYTKNSIQKACERLSSRGSTSLSLERYCTFLILFKCKCSTYVYIYWLATISQLSQDCQKPFIACDKLADHHLLQARLVSHKNVANLLQALRNYFINFIFVCTVSL